ncbi:MAG TPA: glycosyltransferase, partial [Thermoplasmata archaeon]
MHLVVACHRYSPVPGGSERIAQLVAEGAVRRGDRATVITQAEPGVPDREEVNGVAVRRLAMRRAAGVRIPVGYLRALRATGGDVFHLHGNRIWCADFYLPASSIFEWPQVGTGHGFYQYAMGPRPWDRWYFERYFPRVLRGLDLYACDTEFERQQLIGWGYPPDRLLRIPLGAASQEFERPSIGAPPPSWGFRAPRVAVYVGGFFENKRVDRLIDAVALTG